MSIFPFSRQMKGSHKPTPNLWISRPWRVTWAHLDTTPVTATVSSAASECHYSIFKIRGFLPLQTNLSPFYKISETLSRLSTSPWCCPPAPHMRCPTWPVFNNLVAPFSLFWNVTGLYVCAHSLLVYQVHKASFPPMPQGAMHRISRAETETGESPEVRKTGWERAAGRERG